MLIRHRIALLVLVLAPTVAVAQRGGGMGGMGGGMGRNNGGSRGNNAGPQEPTDAQLGAVDTKDLEKLNPITIVLDRKKDLKLPDSTVKLFKKWESTLRDTNKARYREIDSLNKQLHPRDWHNPTGDDTVRAENARHRLDVTTAEIQGRYDSAQAKAFVYLTSDQQTQATTFIQKVLDDVHQSEQDAMRPAYGGHGGSGRRGAPPDGGGPGAGQPPRARPTSATDLQRMNPVAIILSKQAQIGFDDSIVPKLEDLNRELVPAIVPNLKAVDSLNAAAQSAPQASPMPSTAATQADSVVTVIRAQFDVAQSRALAFLTSSQATTAAVLIEQTRSSILRNRGPGGR